MADIQRLDKFLASQTGMTRSEVKEILKSKRVSVDGEIIKKFDTKVDPNCTEICIDNKKIEYKKFIYIMLNKPQGVVCSTKDGLSPTVLDLVPDEMKRKGLFPAGRLDKDTEGFVLITDDGELAHKMLSPKSHVPKKYYVELKDDWQEDYIDRFKKGIIFKDGTKCMPAEFIPDEKSRKNCHVILHEGMFHQVKKMFLAVGNEVTFLKRVQIGDLKMYDNMALGECLEILHKDLAKLTPNSIK